MPGRYADRGKAEPLIVMMPAASGLLQYQILSNIDPEVLNSSSLATARYRARPSAVVVRITATNVAWHLLDHRFP